MKKKMVKKGTLLFVVDENKKRTNSSFNMPIDKELEVGDILNIFEGTKLEKEYKSFVVVVGWIDMFPAVVEVVL